MESDLVIGGVIFLIVFAVAIAAGVTIICLFVMWIYESVKKERYKNQLRKRKLDNDA